MLATRDLLDEAGVEITGSGLDDYFEALQAAGVIVRPMEGYGMVDWVRVSVGTPAENDRLFAELEKLTGSAG